VAETTVTIKYGKGYEETWAVFKGSNDEVRGNILDYFAVPAENVEGLSLSELVVNVTNLAHGKGNAAALLGGVVIGSRPTEPADSATVTQDGKDEAQNTTASDPWADDAPAEPQGPHPVLAVIEAATSVEELKRIWAENQAALTDADLLAAWKAKGKALST
jgi:hypothetical protein